MRGETYKTQKLRRTNRFLRQTVRSRVFIADQPALVVLLEETFQIGYIPVKRPFANAEFVRYAFGRQSLAVFQAHVQFQYKLGFHSQLLFRSFCIILFIKIASF